jgi:hypothetical protein
MPEAQCVAPVVRIETRTRQGMMMNNNSIDYELLTLFVEKRITTHVKVALRKRSSDEAKERSFFVASANEGTTLAIR